MKCQPGDGVYYHGSIESAHGLYTIVDADPLIPGRWVLQSAERGDRLYQVRPASFEVLVMAEHWSHA